MCERARQIVWPFRGGLFNVLRVTRCDCDDDGDGDNDENNDNFAYISYMRQTRRFLRNDVGQHFHQCLYTVMAHFSVRYGKKKKLFRLLSNSANGQGNQIQLKWITGYTTGSNNTQTTTAVTIFNFFFCLHILRYASRLYVIKQ